jgi:hypothetical protein
MTRARAGRRCGALAGMVHAGCRCAAAPPPLPPPSSLPPLRRSPQVSSQLADSQARLEALEAQLGPMSGRSSTSGGGAMLEAGQLHEELAQAQAAFESLAAQVGEEGPGRPALVVFCCCLCLAVHPHT